MINKNEILELKNEGFTIIKNFYDLDEEINPIKKGIRKILDLMVKKYNIDMPKLEFNVDNFDYGYKELISKDRKYGGEVYDAIKQIPAFLRLVSLKKNEILFKKIREVKFSGISAQGYGIRIDNPNEEKYRSLWHYEYRDQFRSQDGIVFWSPLVQIVNEMGPVMICPKSHVDGLRRSYINDPDNPEKSGVYSLRLENEADTINKYGIVQPLSSPGDLIIMDFLTLHSSGENTCNRSRWSMQFRYFNFEHPSGIDISWRGVSNQLKLEEVHPELVIKR